MRKEDEVLADLYAEYGVFKVDGKYGISFHRTMVSFLPILYIFNPKICQKPR